MPASLPAFVTKTGRPKRATLNGVSLTRSSLSNGYNVQIFYRGVVSEIRSHVRSSGKSRYGLYTRLPYRMISVKEDRYHVGIEKQDVHRASAWVGGP
jgi:hypothetical protein